MSNKWWTRLPHSLQGRIALMFVVLAAVVEGLMAAYWMAALEPRLRTEAEAGARVLSQSQAELLAEILSPATGAVRRDEVLRAMDRAQLPVNPNTGRPFIMGVELEIDYDVVEAPAGELDLVRGETAAGDAIVAEIPLHSRTTQELLGIARFYCNDEFFRHFRDDVRGKFFLGSGGVLVLLALAWWGVAILLRPLHTLSTALRVRSVTDLGPLPELAGPVSDEILLVRAALDELFTEVILSTRRLRDHAAELERRNEEMRQFAYIISHDLRAPLINLKGFASVLDSALQAVSPATRQGVAHLDEKQRAAVTRALEQDVPKALGFIHSSVTRIDDFIAAVLKLSRLGRQELALTAIDMNELVAATLRTLAHQIEEGRVQVTVAPLPEVAADRTAMEQIMGNLVTNAVVYLDPDRRGEIEVTADRDPDLTTFHVRDNGRGIAAAEMKKVFAPFQRAGTQDVPGEGMGLAYVQTLVRRHGGRIWCESEPGVGTRFHFTLPTRGPVGG